MADADLHFPGKEAADEPANPAPEPETTEEEPPKEEAPAADPKPEEDPAKEPPKEPDQKLPKKRSIYDDLKDERKDRQDAETRAEAAIRERDEARAKAAELQALLDGKKPADAPAPANELEAYAKENNLDGAALGRLVEIISKQIPKSELSQEERQQLTELKTWKEGKERDDGRAAEDRETLKFSPTVKQQLGIEESAELDKVMAEIVRLTHTPEFHDKDVDYILFKNKATLAKMVSPKKVSFEEGGQPGAPGAEAEPDFSQGHKMTPGAVQDSVERSRTGGGLEVRKSR
jgi:hypothetical protein